MSFLEKDPLDKDPHEPGAKLDDGKPRAGLVLGGFANALLEVANVGTYGARKYSVGSWRKVPDAYSRYLDAGCRHLLLHMAGEYEDPESELPHLAHAIWNFLACFEFLESDREPEDPESCR